MRIMYYCSSSSDSSRSDPELGKLRVSSPEDNCDSPPPSPLLEEEQLKMEVASTDTGLPSSQPPSYSSSSHTPDLDYYPSKFPSSGGEPVRSEHHQPGADEEEEEEELIERDLYSSPLSFNMPPDYNYGNSAFSRFTRPTHRHQESPLEEEPYPLNSLSKDPRDRVMSDGAIMRPGYHYPHHHQQYRAPITSSRLSGIASPCNALSPVPCPQSRGFASSMPFLDTDEHRRGGRAGRSHSPSSDCSRTTNTSRVSLAKRAIHNRHRYSSDQQPGSSEQLDLGRVIRILGTATCGKLLSSAAGCVQHLVYNHNPMKSRVRELGGIQVLVRLLQAEEEVALSALGALRNLSYGHQNHLNKIAIKDSHGIPLLVQLLTSSENFEILELVTGVFWNLSSSEQVKPQLLRQALEPIVREIIVPQSGWKGSQFHQDVTQGVECTTVFRNATGCLRNLSSAGLDGRQAMRSCPGLVDSLLFVLRSVVGKNAVDNKAVENSVCILRNLSYRLDTEVSPEHKYGQAEDWRSRGLGGGQFKRKEVGGAGDEGTGFKKKKNNKKHKGKENATPLPEHTTGVGLLWQAAVVRVYLDLLLECSNPETLEGAAGTLQNLTASTWEPAQILREAVRREKGLSVIVSLLRMANDSVVRSVAVCLRNLALDPRNKTLLEGNALEDLIKRLPGGEGAAGITDLTIGAVISTLLELAVGSVEACKQLRELGGLTRLLEVARCTDVYSAQCVHMSNRVLAVCWELSKDLRKQLKHEGWNISMLQRAPPPERTDGLEYDDSRNQFKASYNSGLNHRVQSPGRSLHSPSRGISPSRGRAVLSPSGYDPNTHKSATIGRAYDANNLPPQERLYVEKDMRGQSLPPRSLPPFSHGPPPPPGRNYAVADSWV